MNKHLSWFLILIFLPLLADAHGLRTTQSQQSGIYTIEFEYDTIGNITAGDFTTFYVYLLDKDRNPIEFDGAFIRISKSNGAPIMVGNLRQASDMAGSSRMSGIIKDSGDYLGSVVFTKSGQAIKSEDFKFTVDPAIVPSTPKRDMRSSIALEAILVSGGFVLGFTIKSLVDKKNKKSTE